ncbi:MAG: hypothetical protein ACYCSI_02250 [Solirubrobacteraceae bacterium]
MRDPRAMQPFANRPQGRRQCDVDDEGPIVGPFDVQPPGWLAVADDHVVGMI